jgi:hypothetical protein
MRPNAQSSPWFHRGVPLAMYPAARSVGGIGSKESLRGAADGPFDTLPGRMQICDWTGTALTVHFLATTAWASVS